LQDPPKFTQIGIFSLFENLPSGNPALPAKRGIFVYWPDPPFPTHCSLDTGRMIKFEAFPAQKLSENKDFLL
jgi:hypothetical protein